VIFGVDIHPHDMSANVFKKSNFCGSRTLHRVL